jgi:hypothetical protein
MALDQNDLAMISQMVSQAVASGGAQGLVSQDFGPLFAQYKITYGTALEFIADTLYDTQTYALAGQTQLTYFQTASTLGTLATTNMPLAGLLPDRQGFLVMSIRCYPQLQPGSNARAASGSPQVGANNDMLTIVGGGVVSFNFLNKDYGKFPLWLLPAGGGVAGWGAAEGATADPGGEIEFANNGIADARNIYVLEQPLFLPPMTKLGVTVNWNAAAPIIRATPVKLVLDGLMVRPVQ